MNILRAGAVLYVLAMASGVSSANVGCFPGSGHTVLLQKTGDIQLVTEDVRIVVRPGSADSFCRFQMSPSVASRPLFCSFSQAMSGSK